MQSIRQLNINSFATIRKGELAFFKGELHEVVSKSRQAVRLKADTNRFVRVTKDELAKYSRRIRRIHKGLSAAMRKVRGETLHQVMSHV